MKRIGLFLLAVLMASVVGCATAGWKYTLIAPQGSNGTVFADEKIEITFNVVRTGVSFILKNKTASGIKINWDDTSITNAIGESRRAIHKGVRLIDKSASQAPSTVPPGGVINDFLSPAENTYLTYRDNWQTVDLFPAYDTNGTGRKINWVGHTFNIYFPMEIEGSRKEYIFTIRIDSPISNTAK